MNENLLRAFKTSCSILATSLTLDFPSASLKSSTYVTSPTTWDIQRKNTKRTKDFKSPSLEVAGGLGNAATDGNVPLMINSQPRPTSHQTTPCLSGQWPRHPKAKAREKHSYVKPGRFKRLQHDQFWQQIPFMAVEWYKNRPLTFQKRPRHSESKTVQYFIHKNQDSPCNRCNKIIQQINSTVGLRLHFGADNAINQVTM